MAACASCSWKLDVSEGNGTQNEGRILEFKIRRKPSARPSQSKRSRRSWMASADGVGMPDQVVRPSFMAEGGDRPSL